MLLKNAMINVSTQKSQKASKGCQLKKSTPITGARLKAIIKKITRGLFILVK
jgi:hypothetical protein